MPGTVTQRSVTLRDASFPPTVHRCAPSQNAQVRGCPQGGPRVVLDRPTPVCSVRHRPSPSRRSHVELVIGAGSPAVHSTNGPGRHDRTTARRSSSRSADPRPSASYGPHPALREPDSLACCESALGTDDGRYHSVQGPSGLAVFTDQRHRRGRGGRPRAEPPSGEGSEVHEGRRRPHPSRHPRPRRSVRAFLDAPGYVPGGEPGYPARGWGRFRVLRPSLCGASDLKGELV